MIIRRDAWAQARSLSGGIHVLPHPGSKPLISICLGFRVQGLGFRPHPGSKPLISLCQPVSCFFLVCSCALILLLGYLLSTPSTDPSFPPCPPNPPAPTPTVHPSARLRLGKRRPNRSHVGSRWFYRFPVMFVADVTQLPVEKKFRGRDNKSGSRHERGYHDMLPFTAWHAAIYSAHCQCPVWQKLCPLASVFGGLIHHFSGARRTHRPLHVTNFHPLISFPAPHDLRKADGFVCTTPMCMMLPSGVMVPSHSL
jgi:hypothetical protein